MNQARLAILNVELSVIRGLRHAEDHKMRAAAAFREEELETLIKHENAAQEETTCA